MDIRMTTVTDNVQKQMDEMKNSLVDLHHTLVWLAGVPEEDISNQQQCSMTATTENILIGTQPVPPGGLGKLWDILWKVDNKQQI